MKLVKIVLWQNFQLLGIIAECMNEGGIYVSFVTTIPLIYMYIYIYYILFQGSKLREIEEKEKNSPPPNNLVGMLAHSKGGLHENFVFMQPSVCMIVDLVPLHMCAMS